MFMVILVNCELGKRNKLNEQQSRKIAYQREVFASKQAELNQLDRRIEELQQRLKKKRTLASNRSSIPTPSTAVVEPFTSTTGYRTAERRPSASPPGGPDDGDPRSRRDRTASSRHVRRRASRRTAENATLE